MKIALINDWFLKYTAQQAVGLKDAGADVVVVCRDHLQEFGGNAPEWQEQVDTMQQAGVDTRIVRGRTKSATAMRTGLAATAALHAWRPHVVHVHPNTDPWLHLAATGFPIVLTIHDPIPHEGQPEHHGVSAALDKGWRNRAKAFVVHGEALKTLTLPLAGDRPIWVIPHGLKPAPHAYPLPQQRRILFFGRLEPYKGIAVLIDAMRQIWESFPDVELTIAGQGPLSAEVPVHPQIRRLFRYIPEPEVDELLLSATLVVAPYTEASQSGVVSLAIARGIPAVVSDQGALPDLAVEPGLVVPAGDPTALARSLVTYLDHGMDLRSRVHAFAQERLSWDATGRKALDLYPEITGRSRS